MEIFKILGTVAIDTNDAEKALSDVSETAKSKSNETSEAFSTIGKVAGTIGKAVVTAGTAIGGAWIAAIEGGTGIPSGNGIA